MNQGAGEGYDRMYQGAGEGCDNNVSRGLVKGMTE